MFLFENNYMKLNSRKCYLLVFTAKYWDSWAKKGNEKIWECNKVKLLGVRIDNKIKFDSQNANICFKANQKVSILSRSVSLLTFGKSEFFLDHFFGS